MKVDSRAPWIFACLCAAIVLVMVIFAAVTGSLPGREEPKPPTWRTGDDPPTGDLVDKDVLYFKVELNPFRYTKLDAYYNEHGEWFLSCGNHVDSAWNILPPPDYWIENPTAAR